MKSIFCEGGYAWNSQPSQDRGLAEEEGDTLIVYAFHGDTAYVTAFYLPKHSRDRVMWDDCAGGPLSSWVWVGVVALAFVAGYVSARYRDV